MGQDEEKNVKRTDAQKDEAKTGEDDMALLEKELKDMQKLQRKEITREELRKAMIQQTIRDNHAALKRLSRT